MPGDTDDLSALFLNANRGDSASYKRLLTVLTPRLRAMVRRGLLKAGRTPDDCEDIVQETLLAIHLKRTTWDESQQLGPWVRAIATYKLIDFLRRQGNRTHVAIDEVPEERLASPGHDAALGVDKERLLGALPERHRRVVEGMAVEGRSAREVAGALGMTEGAVRVTLHRAIQSMSAIYRRGEE